MTEEEENKKDIKSAGYVLGLLAGVATAELERNENILSIMNDLDKQEESYDPVRNKCKSYRKYGIRGKKRRWGT